MCDLCVVMCVSCLNFNIGFICRMLLSLYLFLMAYFVHLLIEFACVTEGRLKAFLDLRQNIIWNATEAYSSIYVGDSISKLQIQVAN
jgi:hypothetical protein